MDQALREPIAEFAPDTPAPSWVERNAQTVWLGLAWLKSRLSDELVASEPTLRARQSFDAARREMLTEQAPSQLDRLAATFGLAPFDEDLLLLTLAPHVDGTFAALIEQAQGRRDATAPTPHLAASLFSGATPAAIAAAFGRLAPLSPLRRFTLLRSADPTFPALAPLIIEEGVARYLLGDPVLDERVRPLLIQQRAGACPNRAAATVARLAAEIRAGALASALLIGPARSGRRAAAAQLAVDFGLALAELKLRLLPQDLAERLDLLRMLGREAALGSFAILIDAEEDAEPGHRQLRDLLRSLDAFTIVIAEQQINGLGRPQGRLEALDTEDRMVMWREALGPGGASLDDGALQRVAEHFRLGPAQVEEVIEHLRSAPEDSLWRACRRAAGQDLDGLAERVEPRFGWGDIVLPEAILHDLHAIADQVRHRSRVYGRGGFGRKLARGRGVSALFAGPSGVGKTMAAEVIAKDLDLDLHRIDLSTVISKYIGETEKNLKRLFEAAEAGGALLFFDEADALFGKRSEVKDSHDRYANIEVNYLLQRMETYSGLAILATNLKGHLDSAFLRRLRFVIDIPFPDASQRRAIWRQAFPAETATEGLDHDALGRIEIPGGHIVVVAVNAAFLAASEGRAVTMSHIARAARAELRKLDRDFKPSWAMDLGEGAGRRP
jgi:ATPase family associated with various cellular activities (AAA)